MTHVVTDRCIRTKYMDCVAVCPVDCFYEGENMLVINPAECIDCGACIAACNAKAIVPASSPQAGEWTSINAQYSQVWPSITSKGNPPVDGDTLRDTPGKASYFSPKPGEGS